MDRRKFVKISAIGSAAVVLESCQNTNIKTIDSFTNTKPLVVSTWKPGLVANKEAWIVLKNNGKSLDAVENGVRVIESDVNNQSVGIGGLPDRNGIVTLDACIMDHKYNCGSVAFLQDIEHPISVARKVMEETPHVMLCGKGAYDFAIEKGFIKTNIGAGLYVDNEIGAACATGIGEAIIKITGSHLVVELMRQGLKPEDACYEAVQRIKKVYSDLTEMQVGFLAVNKAGEHGAYSLYAGFNYALKDENKEELIDSKYEMEW